MPVMAGAESKYRDTIARLDETGMPRTRTFSLQKKGNSLCCTVMRKAWQDAGESFESPGDIKQTYYPEEGLVVLDFDTDE